MPKLVIALGNAGAPYAKTRHNAGFWLADALAAAAGAAFSRREKFRAEIADIGGARIIKPQTMMNDSGMAAAAVMNFYRYDIGDLLVAHDEADLPPGRVKLKQGGGDAGHNGVGDISRALGGGGYWRLRIGIGKPAGGGDISDYVLRAPAADERARIDAAIGDILRAWSDIAGGDFAAAMRVLHAAAA